MQSRLMFLSRIGSLFTLLLLASLFVGCGQTADDFPLDQARADEALKQFLEHWKSGGKPDGLEAVRPGLVVGDIDWESGAVLKSYQIAPEGFSDGVNWHVNVTLELEVDGRSDEVVVPYIIGTSPVETIFRK